MKSNFKNMTAALAALGIFAGCAKQETGSSGAPAGSEQSGLEPKSTEVRVSIEPKSTAGTIANDLQALQKQTADSVQGAVDELKSSDIDRRITQAIRKAIVIEPGKDEHSFSAKNIQIDVSSGQVTLRGQVKSDQEKKDIEDRARAVPGVTGINNQLEIKP